MQKKADILNQIRTAAEHWINRAVNAVMPELTLPEEEPCRFMTHNLALAPTGSEQPIDTYGAKQRAKKLNRRYSGPRFKYKKIVNPQFAI
tara:strand:+ start:3071 stop:3340 length:270 start_codon:yes stop_codon:yes gene_type:complete